jgi:hypothetical protein
MFLRQLAVSLAIAFIPLVLQVQAQVVRPPSQNRPLPSTELPAQGKTDPLAKPNVTRVSFVPSTNPWGSNTVRIEGNLFGATHGRYGIKALVQQGGRQFSGRCFLPQHREICETYVGNIFLRVRNWSGTEIIAEYDPIGRSYNITNGVRRLVQSPCRLSPSSTHQCMSLEQIRRFVAGSISVGLVEPGTDRFVSTTATLSIQPVTFPPSTTGDVDGDGIKSTAQGGTDCDDRDPRRFPSNPEVGDIDGLDEDCNPQTFGEQDRDGDRHFNYAFFNVTGGGRIYQGRDCDDLFGGANPGAPEVCGDYRDNDCDGYVDDLPTCR